MATITFSNSVPLSTLVRNFDQEIWKPALWQRKLVWPKSKQDRWISDVQKGGGLPGVISMFQIERQEETITLDNIPYPIKYINDGIQRTLTLINFKRNSKLPENHLWRIFDNSSICVQILEYKTLNEAFMAFHSQNRGTICTPYEACHGLLINNLQNYKQVWEKRVDELHDIFIRAIARMKCSKKGAGKEKQDKHLRDDYALFLRFVTCDRDLKSYNVANRVLADDAFDENIREKLVEFQLQKYLNNIGPEEFDKKKNELENHINNILAEYENIWISKKDNGYVPTITNIRWLLAVSIYKRNNEIPHNKFINFVEKYIDLTDGGSVLGGESSRQRIIINLSNLTCFPKMCEMMDMDFGEFFKPVRKARKSLAPGYNNSHLKPFVTYGEGETIPEPALSNMSRGAKEFVQNTIIDNE